MLPDMKTTISAEHDKVLNTLTQIEKNDTEVHQKPSEESIENKSHKISPAHSKRGEGSGRKLQLKSVSGTKMEKIKGFKVKNGTKSKKTSSKKPKKGICSKKQPLISNYCTTIPSQKSKSNSKHSSSDYKQ